MENEMHPYDRISHSKLFSEGLAELTLALLKSPNPCDKSLYVLHEMTRRVADELAMADADLRGTVPVKRTAAVHKVA